MPIWLRILTILLSLSTITVWIGLGLKYRKQWLYTIPPLLWMINLVIFEIFAYLHALGFNDIDFSTLNVWASILFLQALITILGVGIAWLIEGVPYNDIG